PTRHYVEQRSGAHLSPSRQTGTGQQTRRPQARPKREPFPTPSDAAPCPADNGTSRRGSAHTSAAQSGPARSRTDTADPLHDRPAGAENGDNTQAPPNRPIPLPQAYHPVHAA